MLCPSQAGDPLPFSPLQTQRPIFLFVITEGWKSDKHPLHLKTKSWKETLPVFQSWPLLTHFHGLLQNRVTKTHSEKWLVHKQFTHKGPGSLLISLALISLKVGPCIWHCGGFVFFVVCLFGSVKDQFCGIICPQTGRNTHLWHLKVELATAWHWKCLLHLQCLDFPMCAQLQLVKQKCTCHPYCYSVATEPSMWKTILWKKDFCVLL